MRRYGALRKISRPACDSDRPRYSRGFFCFGGKVCGEGNLFGKRFSLPVPHPSKNFYRWACARIKGGYAVHQLRQAFYFCQFVRPCFFTSRDKASLAACPDACLGACVGTASACQECVTGLWPWKIQRSQRRQGTSCSCGTGDSCRDRHPPAWEMATRAEKTGAAVGRSPRAGKEWLENRGQEGIVWFLRGAP